MLTPSKAESPPSVLAGLDILEPSSLSVESPAKGFVDCEKAYSRALSILSSHSWVEYLLPSGSLVVLFGSSKMNCLSRWRMSVGQKIKVKGKDALFPQAKQ
jgi:hypothetical protein